MRRLYGRLARPLPRAPLRLAAILALGMGAVVVLPDPAHAATATLRRTNEWSAGCIAEMTVRNTSWRVLPCDGGRLDVTPPSTPTNVQGSYMRMIWDASTDDRGVVAYELLDGTNVRATVTGTSYTYTGPPPPPRVYYLGVRAVDAAGNRSPVAALAEGAPDLIPPRTPTNLTMSGPARGYFTVRWTTPSDTQIVAGYEVYLNDVLVRKVGGTTAYVPYRGFGEYLVAVRAYDPAGNFSAFARVGIAVDPAPPGAP